MATNTVQTVTGPVDAADLGRTLVHEHIRISYWGEEYDRNYAWKRADAAAIAVDKMAELLDAGFRTFVDPCPIELGREEAGHALGSPASARPRHRPNEKAPGAKKTRGTRGFLAFV